MSVGAKAEWERLGEPAHLLERGILNLEGLAPDEDRVNKWLGTILSEIDGLLDETRSEEVADRIYDGFRAVNLILRTDGRPADHLERRFDIYSPTIAARLDLPYVSLAAPLEHDARKRVVSRAQEIVRAELTAKAPLPQRKENPSVGAVRYGETRWVYFAKTFAESMVGWSKGDMDSTSQAVEVLKMTHDEGKRLGRVQGEYEVEPAILHYVDSLYDASSGQYRNNDDADSTGELYATRSAIVIYKALEGAGCHDVLSPDKLKSWTFLENAERKAQIKRSTLNRLDSILESTSESEPPTIIELHLALYVSLYLGAELEDNLFDRVVTFVQKCQQDASSDEPASFALDGVAAGRCLTACLFVNRIRVTHEQWLRRRYNVKDPEPDWEGLLRDSDTGALERWTYLSSSLHAVRDFVKTCMAAEGGFAFGKDEQPDMIHTFMALLLSKDLGWGLEDDPDVRAGVIAFLGGCRYDGGYSLLKYWRPMAYSTRLALQTLLLLKVPFPEPWRTVRFINSLRIEDEKEFVRYRGLIDTGE